MNWQRSFAGLHKNAGAGSVVNRVIPAWTQGKERGVASLPSLFTYAVESTELLTFIIAIEIGHF